MTLIAGTTVGRYQILSPLGQGGMATVYKAFQPSLEREVALKVLRPGFAQDQEFLERFEREAKAIARLRHGNIVQVFDFETVDGQYVLAMEFLEGGTLKERLSQLAAGGRGMEPTESLRILGEIAGALSYAHELGIIHRDIKPANVMLTRKDWAVVTDFGIARILGATSHTQTGVGIGTPEYMAPEQGQGGKVDQRADIYSLGAMAYEMLTGRVPYVADTPLAVVIAHIKDPLPLPSQVNPTIGPALEKALLKALAKDPEQRFASATDFAEAMRQGLAEDQRGGTVPTVVVRGAAAAASVQAAVAPASISFTLAVPPVLRQRPVAIGGAAIGLALLLVAGAVTVGPLRSNGAPTSSPTAGPSVAPASGVPTAQAPVALTGLSFTSLRGALTYDGSREERAFSMTGPAEFAKLEAGVLEVSTPPAGVRVEAFVGPPVGTAYAAEMDVFIEAGSVMRFAVCLRGDGTQRYCVTTLAPGSTSVKYLRSDSDVGVPWAGEVIGAIPNGRTVQLAYVVDGGTFTVFVDDRAILQVKDPPTSFTSSRNPVSFQAQRILSSPEGTGTARVSNIRLYALATSASTAGAFTPAPTSAALSSPGSTTAQPVAAGAFTPAPVTPTPIPTPGPTAKFAIPAKGRLQYQMPLDGLGRDIRGVPESCGAPENRNANWSYLVGAIQIDIPGSGTQTCAKINVTLADPSQYIVEFELSVSPNSELGFFHCTLNNGSCPLQVSMSARSQGEGGEMVNVYTEAPAPDPKISVPITGIRNGRTVVIALVSRHPQYELYVDQQLAGRFSVPADLGRPDPGNISIFGESGSIRILGARYYELP